MKFSNNVVPLFPASRTDVLSEPVEVLYPDIQDDAGQLSLLFEAPCILYVVNEKCFRTIENFYHFSVGVNVGALLDMRLTPRLDFVAPSRQRAFQLLKEINVSYVDMLGRSGFAPAKANAVEYVELLKEVILVSETICSKDASRLMVFDDKNFMDSCHNSLRHCFEIIEAAEDVIASLAHAHAQLRM
ncbi:hypothetical protein GT347_17565 [Xylophilus rhododendri]|uniref:Uncharacterized protein n=1 Tax=Xylophilus rhododendri TaxID=2697032 RepID=A0A857J6J7_9BURK|nr:hypothetical protein [Xylophilus rhododendri]QHI99624.1 hypothetical protein GT347_17565 [Xylophilus rhododendri]